MFYNRNFYSIFGQKIAPDGINAWNPAFDVTPSKLIKGIITELGVIEAIGDESAVDYDGVIRIKDFLMSNITQGNDELLLRCENSVTPSSVPSNYTRLDVKKIGHYIFTNPILLDQLKVDAKSIEIYQTDQSIQSDTLKIAEVGDGNLNYVFIVSNITNGQTIVIKQALPYVRCVGESWPLTLERATFEYKALIQESRHTQGKYVPEVYYFDETNALFGEFKNKVLNSDYCDSICLYSS